MKCSIYKQPAWTTLSTCVQRL